VPAAAGAESQAAAKAPPLCVECRERPAATGRKGARFCGGACRTVANRRDRAARAYAALAAALPGGSKRQPYGPTPERLAAAAPRLLAVVRAMDEDVAGGEVCPLCSTSPHGDGCSVPAAINEAEGRA
jgi:hypothetical protein